MNNALTTLNGNNLKAKTLEQWLSFALGTADFIKEDGTPGVCVGFSLHHVNGSVEKEIHGMSVAGKTFNDSQVKQLAEMLEGLAQTDAQSLPGLQRYIVYALYDGFSAPKARYPFAVNGHISNRPGDFSTEPATPEGRLTQRMRHDEAYSQLLIMGTGQLVQAQANLIRLQGDRLDQTMRENRDMLEHTVQMLMEQATQNREHDLKVLAFERNTKMLQGMAKVAPAMLNTITGKEVVPQSTVDTQILETIADVLDENTLAQLAPVLAKVPPEMQGVLFSRLEQITKKKEAEKQRVDKALTTSNPENVANAELDGG
jgi:hypothetical protein